MAVSSVSVHSNYPPCRQVLELYHLLTDLALDQLVERLPVDQIMGRGDWHKVSLSRVSVSAELRPCFDLKR